MKSRNNHIIECKPEKSKLPSLIAIIICKHLDKFFSVTGFFLLRDTMGFDTFVNSQYLLREFQLFLLSLLALVVYINISFLLTSSFFLSAGGSIQVVQMLMSLVSPHLCRVDRSTPAAQTQF